MPGWPLLSPSDATLVARVLRDDAGAFEVLVGRFQRRAHAITLALGVPPASADDVLQEAFLKAFEKLPHLRDPARFGPWFLQIVRNAARSRLRVRDVEPCADAASIPAPAGESPEDGELKALLWKKVAELPEGIREAIYLYYHEGETARAVARTLGVSRAAALKRLERGRELLREELWRSLRDSLREMVPSTREWAKKGRQLTIILFGMSTAGWGARAAAAAAPAGALGLGPGAGTTKTVLLEGTVMATKKIGISLGLAAFVLIGGLVLFLGVSATRERGRDVASRPAPGVAPAPAGKATAGSRAAPIDGAAGPRAETTPAAPGSPPPRLEGTVVTVAGEPVEGATVIALHVESWDAILAAANPELWQVGGEDAPPRLRSLFAEYSRRAAELPRTTTDGAGKYSFLALEEGEHRVIVTHPDFVPSTETWALVRGAETARRDVVLREGLSISGRVRDARGLPIAGAQVTARGMSQRDHDDSLKVSLLESWAEARFLSGAPPATSGEDGAFRVTSLEPALFDLRVSRPGHAGAVVREVPAGSDGVEITLNEGLSISGTVIAAGGSPLEDVRVTVRLGSTAKPKPPQVGEAMYEPVSDDIDIERDEPLVVRTDVQGRFLVEGVRPGVHEVLLEKEGFISWKDQVRLRDAPVDTGTTPLDRALPIRGRVLGPQGAPVVGARVWIEESVRRGMPNWGGRYAIPPPLVESRTGSVGEFSLDVGGGGSYTLRAASLHLAPATLLAVPAGSGGVEIRLEEGFAIRGTVVDGIDGSPIDGAVVTLLTGLSDVEVAEKKVRTGADGRFEISGLERNGDEIRLRASHEDYRGPAPIRRLGHEPPAGPVKIDLYPPEEIQGVARTAGGQPASRARVRIEMSGVRKGYVLENLRPGLGTARAEEDGSFSILLPREFRVHRLGLDVVAEWDGGERGRVSSVAAPEGNAPWPQVEIILSKGAVLSGRIVDADSRPVARAIARAVRSGSWGKPAACHSGADGAYAFDSLEPGTYEVEVQAPGFARSRAADIVIASGAVERDFVLDAGVVLEGRVVDDTGRGIEGAVVWSLEPDEADREISERAERVRLTRRWNAEGVAFARTGAGGRYRLEHVPEREWTLIARAPGHEPSALAPLRPGEEPEDLVVRRLADLAGAVVDAETGRPVPSFRLCIFRYRDRSDGEFIPRDFDDPLGRFSIESIPAGTHVLAILTSDHVTFVEDVELVPGETFRARVALERGRTLRGTIQDAGTGAPVAGASVQCHPHRSETPIIHKELMWSGADGAFVVEGLLPGKHTVYIHHPGYVRMESKLVVTAEEDPEPLRVEMHPAGGFAGVISGFRRAPQVTDAHLVLEPTVEGQGEKYRYIRFDAEGRFETHSVRPATYEVILREEKLEKTLKPGDSFGPNDTSEKLTPLGQVEIRPGETARFEVRVQ